MGYDKYDIDWSVFGAEKPKVEPSGNPMQGSIGRGWSPTNDATSVDDSESADSETATQPKTKSIRITSAKFITNEETSFLKECKIRIEAQGDPSVADVALWGTFNGTDYDLRLSKSVNFSDGIAESTLSLEYIDEFYNEYYGDGNSDAFTDYFFYVTCNGAEKKKSELLRMPLQLLIECDFVELHDGLFHHNCALPSLDPENVLIDSLVAAFKFASDNADREVIIEGHADKSGEADYNLTISKRRAEAIKALISNDESLWNGVVSANGSDHKIETEDYQQSLKSLATRHRWPCDPGEVDNKKGPKTEDAVKKYQSRYNQTFPDKEQLIADGDFGPKSWGSLFFVLRDLFEKGLKSAGLELSQTLNYGYSEGNGIYPCGESCSLTGQERSEEDRRVELVFYKQGEAVPAIPPSADRTLSPDTDPVTGKKWNKKPVNADPSQPEVTSKIPHVIIAKLDKWFIPGAADKGGENCDLKYSLSAVDSFTGKVTFDVFGSNYCNAKVNNDFSIKFTPIATDVAVYSEIMPADKSQAGQQYEITDWNGKSNATDGALKPRTGKDRYINVLFSPYTAHFRCFQNDSDKEARIGLLDFWPRWDTTGTVENGSLTVKWNIRNTAKLKEGKILIFDKTDTEVFSKDLVDVDLSEGNHEFAWDGSLTSGGTLSKDSMPYRVQIQGWSSDAETDGVSIAAMHTEVRLFVHPDTGKHPDDLKLDPNSLQFSLAPFAPKVPDENSEEESWYQHRLAELGYHPGPIDGVFGAKTQSALKEFQRTSPKNNAAPYTRLKPDGTRNADTKNALKSGASFSRSLFGNPDDNMNDITEADLITRVNDIGKEVVIWVDDRHYYTTPWAKDATLSNDLWLDNYHGVFDCGDNKVGIDANSVPRPYLPIQVDIPLLSKSSDLDATSGTVNDASRAATGLLRTNWTFEETGEDLTVIDTAHPNYTNRVRTKKWVEVVTAPKPAGAAYGVGATYNGKTLTNCPDGTSGGIRPSNADNYYKAPFSLNAGSLRPWYSMDDTVNKNICTLVYGETPDATDVFDSHIGKAGVFVVPSRIGGDGYRFRVSVSFDKLPNICGDLRNIDILKKRYSNGSKADTSAMRVWRRASFRGYVGWSPAADQSKPIQDFFNLYKPVHVQFVNEGANPANVNEYLPSEILTQAEFSAVITRLFVDPDFAGKAITLNDEYLWPHCGENRLGFDESIINQPINNYRSLVISKLNAYWENVYEQLMENVIQKFEEKKGVLKGHLIGEYLISPQITVAQYRCNNPACGATRCQVENNAGADTLNGKNCSLPGCGGVYQPTGATSVLPEITPFSVGLSLGCCWLVKGSNSAYWAHEVGHNRHLEHCQCQLDGAGNTSYDTAGVLNQPGGFKNNQHDSEPNPAIVGVEQEISAWDRACMMSYNDFDPNYFCGKCVLKSRGWAVETIVNPPGNVS
jgi:peptidoglycan hydrolase-like protein with peptidoglycan-binding domain